MGSKTSKMGRGNQCWSNGPGSVRPGPVERSDGGLTVFDHYTSGDMSGDWKPDLPEKPPTDVPTKTRSDD